MLRRAMLLAAVWMLAAGAHGFCLSYGTFFDVCGVRYEGSLIKLPSERGQYKNIKLLTQNIYTFVQGCRTDCRYMPAQSAFEIGEWRRAFTQKNMLIADVDFDGQISLTFLIFKNDKDIKIKNPDGVIFTDQALEKRVHQSLADLAVETL